MRDPERIDRILILVRQVWVKYPDWRLGQLVVNMAGRDPWYLEDHDLERELRRALTETSKVK